MGMSREEAADLIEMFGSACLDNAQYAEQHDQGDTYAMSQYHLCEEQRQRLKAQLLTALCADPNAALLEACRSALQAVEWITEGTTHALYCVWCKEDFPDHAPDCARQAALAYATDAACANTSPTG